MLYMANKYLVLKFDSLFICINQNIIFLISIILSWKRKTTVIPTPTKEGRYTFNTQWILMLTREQFVSCLRKYFWLSTLLGFNCCIFKK